MGRRSTRLVLRVAGAATAAIAATAQVPDEAAAPEVPTCFGKRPTIVGTPGDDRIFGTRGADVIAGRGGNDVLHGGDRRDRICGGRGDDEVDGRYGGDLVDAGPGDDRVRGGPGDDLVIGGPGADVAKGGDGDDSDTLVGGAGRDVLYGGHGDTDEDYLFGGPGLDFMQGGLGGRDHLFGGPGNDRMGEGAVSYQFSATPVVVDLRPQHTGPSATGEGHDYLGSVRDVVGSPHDDVIRGPDGGASLRGGAGDDRISGGTGFDEIDGGAGDDVLDGAAGADLASFVDAAAGVVASLSDARATGAGADSLSGFDRLRGSYYDDGLTADDARNWVYGSYGVNEIFGLGGDDYLEFGDAGDAGDGVDECIWSELENCEQSGHFDPPSLPYLTSPRQARPVEKLETVRGDVAGGLGGPHDPTILVSIRRMTPSGCWWWHGASGHFVRAGCGDAIRNRVADQDGRWSLPVREALRPGAYRVSVTWSDADFLWPECAGAFAPMCVSFDVR